MPCEVKCVISNRPDAAGLETAKMFGIDTRVLDHKEFSDRETYDNALAALVESFKPNLVVLAGLWTALNHPLVFLALLIVFVALAIWLLPKLWRLLKYILQKIRAFFGGQAPEPLSNVRFAGDVLPSPHAGASGDTVSELERLKALRDSGAITEEEFAAAKKKLLD